MNYLKSHKLALEESILISLLNQNYCNEFDLMEYRDFKIPYEHFNSNLTTKLVSKAIFNLQANSEAITEDNIYYYISKHTEVNSQEWLGIVLKLGFSFDTMELQLKKLIEINKEIKLNERLREI